jgi:uncharacterized protein (DUF302 family)
MYSSSIPARHTTTQQTGFDISIIAHEVDEKAKKNGFVIATKHR